MFLAPQTAGLLLAAAAFAMVLLSRAALPTPIPGIPYDKKSASRLLGDVPDVLEYHAKTREMITFLEKKCRELGGPICQVFVRPFARPWVVILDGRESQDIMARRSREFDRSDFFGDLLVSLLPMNQVHMRTNDQWRYNRRLMADAMSPRFLNNVAAYRVHENTQDLVDLWKQKIRIAKGHVIDVSQDIKFCTVDTIWAATFGSSAKACKSQTEYLSGLPAMAQATTTPAEVTKMPVKGLSKIYSALAHIAESSEIPMNSPFGRYHHWFATKTYPYLRNALSLRNRLIREKLQQAWKTFADTGGSAGREGNVNCVVDLIVEKETTLAKKQGKEPEKESPFLHDELAGFLNAGFETTSSSVNWGLKYLTKHQDVQEKLRQALYDAFPQARKNGQQPAPKDIAEAHLPYLEAYIDEVLRFSSIIAANVRVATQDAQVLGCLIPKGTDVFMLTTGPSYRSPALTIDEQKRSISSREFKADYERWDQAMPLSDFNPGRWLTKKEKTGQVEFDPRAAPMQIFGAGVRSCYGKKLAYLEMRTIYSLIVWNFELLPIPESLVDFKAQDVITHQTQNVRIIPRALT